jgi:hypothetical protein
LRKTFTQTISVSDCDSPAEAPVEGPTAIAVEEIAEDVVGVREREVAIKTSVGRTGIEISDQESDSEEPELWKPNLKRKLGEVEGAAKGDGDVEIKVSHSHLRCLLRRGNGSLLTSTEPGEGYVVRPTERIGEE